MKRKLLIHQFQNPDKKKYKVYLSKSPSTKEGDCDAPPPIVKTPIIRIRNTLMRQNRARRQLAIIIEEMLHAHDFNLTEKVVRKYAANTMKLLYKLGWRWEPDKINEDNFKDLDTFFSMLGMKRDWQKKKSAKCRKK